MPPAPRNERRPQFVPRTWKILRVAAKARVDEGAQLRLRIGELEEMIVGAEEKEVRRRVAGFLPTDSAHARSGMPLRYAEKRALQQQRLKGWLGIGVLGLLLILIAAWFFVRLSAVS